MMALSTKDVDTLTKMSMMPGETDEQIRKQWDFVKNGDSDWEMSLWLILVFQAWNEEWLRKP